MTPNHDHNMARFAQFPGLGQVCRLGLATRGNTYLDLQSVNEAIHRGINYVNWCGRDDGLSQAIASMKKQQRRGLFVATQLSARDRIGAERELTNYLRQLKTDYIDVLTYYYVEHEDEWARIMAPDGAAKTVQRAKLDGRVRSIGLTSHQRSLAATIAQSGQLDMLMIRYNAAHRGAEQDVFPITKQRGMPVVTFTAQRWGALMKNTPDDPPNYQPPTGAAWYRFVLCHKQVTVAIMAPNGCDDLEQNLQLLDDWHSLDADEFQQMCAHGDRVRRHAGHFV